MVSVSVQSALAATLVDDGTSLLDAADGPAPLAVEVWLNSRTEATTAATPAADSSQPDFAAAAPAVGIGAAAASA